MNELFIKHKSIGGSRQLKKVSPSTMLVLQEAEDLGITWEKLPYTDLFKLSFQGKVKYFHAQIPAQTTALASYCCENKRIAKSILEEAGISVTNGLIIQAKDVEAYRQQVFMHLQKPLVVKPIDDSQGNNVFLNIETADQFNAALQQITNFYGRKKITILVEEMFAGDEYRILATNEKILSVIRRIPANVIGDGISTIENLIEKKNANPLRTLVATYKPITVDESVIEFLNNQQLQLDTVLSLGRQVFLRAHSPFDISHGGDTVDVTDQIHTDVVEIVQTIMESIPGLVLSGIDYMTADITQPQTKDTYKIIELNASPSLDWNQFPLVGEQRPIAYEFLKLMFPQLKK